MFNRIATKSACLRFVTSAFAVSCLAGTLAIARPSNAAPAHAVTICVMEDDGQPFMPLQQFQIFLYDEYGYPVDVSDVCSYQVGHVFDSLGEDIGVVNYQTGHVFDSLNNDIGYVVPR